MQIRKIDTNQKRDVRKFIRFPFQLYKGNKFWVPPLISDMELVLDRNRHPFYQHSDAEFLIAESEGEVLGRLAVIHNRNYCAVHQETTGFFYYADFIDDPQVVNGLLTAALE